MSDNDQNRSLGYDISAGSPTEFQERVLNILQDAAKVYRDRSAVYKDNFRAVGRVMVALFPDGRPPLVTAADYDRWHIFELLIVKLTRYGNNYDQPHEDSLLDMIPYLGILGALDQELREREEDQGPAQPTIYELGDDDLPGMWSRSDFMGGQDEAEAEMLRRLTGPGGPFTSLRYDMGDGFTLQRNDLVRFRQHFGKGDQFHVLGFDTRRAEGMVCAVVLPPLRGVAEPTWTNPDWLEKVEAPQIDPRPRPVKDSPQA